MAESSMELQEDIISMKLLRERDLVEYFLFIKMIEVSMNNLNLWLISVDNLRRIQ